MLSWSARPRPSSRPCSSGAATYLNKPFEEESWSAPWRGRSAPPGRSGGAPTPSRALLSGATDRRARPARADLGTADGADPGRERRRQEIWRAPSTDLDPARRPFVKVTARRCPHAAGSEIFGYERGAFTGALHGSPASSSWPGGHDLPRRDRRDEPGAPGQAAPRAAGRALRAPRGNREISVDARVVNATNRDLAELVARGGFRRTSTSASRGDHREARPLRERAAERGHADRVPAAARLRALRRARALSGRRLRALERHPLPRNVRELENLLKRIVVLRDEEPVLRRPAASTSRPCVRRSSLEARARRGGAQRPESCRCARWRGRRPRGRARHHRARALPEPLEPQAGRAHARVSYKTLLLEDPRVWPGADA